MYGIAQNKSISKYYDINLIEFTRHINVQKTL